MKIKPLKISDVLLIMPQVYEDARGYFFETFNKFTFQKETGVSVNFVQDNQSLSRRIHTVRGLHYQSYPHAQGKLVRCTAGSLLDVAVDVRINSPTFGHHVKVELSRDNKAQLWIPAGFLHGFATLEPNTVIQYKCTDVYNASCDGSVLWNDAQLDIDWGFDPKLANLSEKDTKAQTFASFESPFSI